MEEQKKEGPVNPGEESLSEKAKKLVDKADDFIEEKAEQVKKSKAYGEVTEAFDKAEDFIEKKVEDLKQKGVKETIADLADKADDKAEEAISKLKDLGKKVAYKTADKLGDLAENIKNKTRDDSVPPASQDNNPRTSGGGAPAEDKPADPATGPADKPATP